MKTQCYVYAGTECSVHGFYLCCSLYALGIHHRLWPCNMHNTVYQSYIEYSFNNYAECYYLDTKAALI